MRAASLGVGTRHPLSYQNTFIFLHRPYTRRYTSTPEYYVEDGLRKVKPYWESFVLNTKLAWMGCRLIDILSKAVPTLSCEQLLRLMERRDILLNDNPTHAGHRMRPDDIVFLNVPRCDPPVLHLPISVLHSDEAVVAVDKPPSIPVHRNARFNHNSLLAILRHEYGLSGLSPVNRLDGPVGGVVLLARNARAKTAAMRLMGSQGTQKTYVARVEGDMTREGREVICDMDMLPMDWGLGYARIASSSGHSNSGEKTKHSKTVFYPIRFDGRHTLVRCVLYTGRTHQIRAHLQYLGFPIINDPIYNHHFAATLPEQVFHDYPWDPGLQVPEPGLVPKVPQLRVLRIALHAIEYRIPAMGMVMRTVCPNFCTKQEYVELLG